jgi:hypothetical protein
MSDVVSDKEKEDPGGKARAAMNWNRGANACSTAIWLKCKLAPGLALWRKSSQDETELLSPAWYSYRTNVAGDLPNIRFSRDNGDDKKPAFLA